MVARKVGVNGEQRKAMMAPSFPRLYVYVSKTN